MPGLRDLFRRGVDPLAEAARLTAAANDACARGDYDAALPMERASLALTERALGPDHLDTAARLADVAGTLHFLDEDEEALALAQRALAITERTAGPDSELVVERLGSASLILAGLGRAEDALALRLRAHALALNLYGPGSARLIVPLATLANSLDSLDRGAEALPLRRQCVDIAREAFAVGDPRRARRLAELALSLAELGDHAAAADSYADALEGLPEQHADYSNYLGRRGAAVLAAGRPAEARPILERAVRLDTERGAPRIQRTNAHHHLAQCLSELGEPRLALPHREAAVRDVQDPAVLAGRIGLLATTNPELGRSDAAVRLREASLQVWSPPTEETAVCLSNLAGDYYDLERMPEAIATMEKALALTVQLHGDQSVAYAERLGTFGELLRVDERLEPALAWLTEALRILDGYGPEVDGARALCATQLAHVYDDLGDEPNTLRLRHYAIERARRAHGPRHPDVATYLNNLGGALANFRRFSEARAAYTEAVELALDVCGPGSPTTALILNNLAGTLQSQGERTAARALLTRSVEAMYARLGPDNLQAQLFAENLANLWGSDTDN